MSLAIPANKADLILLKDKKIAIFYTNDLYQALSVPILHDDDPEAILCVCGLTKIYQWTGNEIMTCTAFNVLSFVVGYNLYMNAVNCLDQMRSTNKT